MNDVIIVWKDGTHKPVKKDSAWEYENDNNWLTTIHLDEMYPIGFIEWIGGFSENRIRSSYEDYKKEIEKGQP